MTKVQRVFTYGVKQVRKEALWLVSNIAANSEQDATVVANHQMMANILFAGRDNAHDMRKEAIWAISNIVYNIKDTLILKQLVERDLVTLLLERLQYDSDSGPICSMCLTTLSILMERSPEGKEVFFKLCGEDVVQDLQVSPYHEVYKQSADLLEKHCGAQPMDQLEKMEFINSRNTSDNNFNI